MKHIRMEIDGAVGRIIIDRRQRFNSFDVETAQDFRKAGLQFARDEAVRAVVIQGVEGVFCSGADLKYIRRSGAPEAGRSETPESREPDRDLGYLQPSSREVPGGYGEVFKQILEYLHSTISEIKRAPKPFLAAVDGIAAAGGFGIAMACDLVLASERATFEWAYSRTGLTGAESSTFFLPRLLGLRRALDLVFLNPRLDARKAHELGLVSAVYPTASFAAEVDELARRLAAGPTRAYGVAKGLIHRAAGVDRLDHHLDQELDNLARIADTADFAEGMASFFAKRQPVFAGR